MGCVSAEVADGQICNESKRNTMPMTGCKPGASCIRGPITDQNNNVIPDQGSCGRVCGAAVPCAAPNTYCNPNVLNSTTTNGVCAVAKLAAGAVCGQEDITRFCDRSHDTMTTGLACIGMPDNAPNDGICVELCDPTHHPDTCPATSTNPGRAAVCKAVIPGMATVGVCSDECTRYPNNCTGQGIGNGAECSPPLIFGQTSTVPASFCVDVQTPVLMQWLKPGMNFPGCGTMQGDQLHCPSGTYCEEQADNTGKLVTHGCIRGCSTSSVVTAPMHGCTMTATICANFQATPPTADGYCTQ
jgi:hypothetical protein